MASGYERSPDYGGPEPSWRHDLDGAALIAVAAVTILLALAVRAGHSEPIQVSQFTVTDGDTIRLVGASAGTRLVGFNAPETSNAECPRERELGERATDRLRELVATPMLDLTIGRLRLPARNPRNEFVQLRSAAAACCGPTAAMWVHILIAEGLAVPFVCGATSCPPTPRPWCD